MLTKKNFITLFRVENDLSARQAKALVESFLSLIQNSLTNGNAVSFQGFGKWKTYLCESRKGCNPKTLESIDIPEMVKTHFYPGQILKKAVRQAGVVTE